MGVCFISQLKAGAMESQRNLCNVPTSYNRKTWQLISPDED